MPHLRNRIAAIVAALTVASLLFLATPLAQNPAPSANPEDPNFDFSVYYTGNVRGNLEPCG